MDSRFSYEPLLAGHPEKGSWGSFDFLGKKMEIPLWVSSMTGGTEMAKTINHNTSPVLVKILGWEWDWEVVVRYYLMMNI